MSKRRRTNGYPIDRNKLVPPTENDFQLPHGPLRRHWPEVNTYKEEVTEPGPTFAPAPWIPSWNDDSKRTYTREVVVQSRAKRTKRGLRARRGRLQTKANTEPVIQPAPPPLPPFLRLPLEVRLNIYRHLLVHTENVLVHGGWKRLYQRFRPVLATSILKVNRQIENEAIQVLYGENTFQYLLRDPSRKMNEISDIERLTYDDVERDSDYEADEESDGGSVYEGFPSRRAQARRAQPQDRGYIDLDQFGHLMRHLVVKAESNRYTAATLQSMAEALEVFSPLSKRKGVKDPNIHTLEICVAPSYLETSYTFIDFFDKNSPVVKVLKDLKCQFLKIILETVNLNDDLPTLGSIFFLDMRPLMVYRRKLTSQMRLFASDRILFKRLRQMAAETGRTLERLDDITLACCKGRSLTLDDIEEWEYDD